MWWKYIGAALLFYILIGGMLVPLAPGIKMIDPITFPSDSSIAFVVTGYNTHFQYAKDLQIWFKNETNFYCADQIEPIINSTVKVTFSFPRKSAAKLNVKSFDLVVNDALDGTISLRDAVFMTRRADSIAADDTSGLKATCANEARVSKFPGFAFPNRDILYQTIRNTFYHVPMWFTMMFILIISTVFSIMYLNGGKPEHDIIASQSVNVALLFGTLGLTTGMTWATYTWGSPWPNDPKLHGAAVGVIIYLAYIVLRGSFTDEIKRARISAVYNVFAIIIFILFIFIIPRLTDSLHPGNGGNPAFSKYDLDSHLRMFFYPAVIGWILLGMWLLSISVRIRLVQLKKQSI